MLSLVHQSQEDLRPEHGASQYVSKGLQVFLKKLELRDEVKLLDVGPVCGENINFLAPKVEKLYVCDIFSRLSKALCNGHPPSHAMRYLDYPPESFDGVLLWDLVGRFDNEDAGRLGKLCYSLVKPGGLVAVFVFREETHPPVVKSFAILDSFRLYLRIQHHLNLPIYFRENREVLELLAPFTLVKSFIYRNSLMEFILQR